MYAIIQTGGKQYHVSEGDEIFIEKLDKFDGDEITFDQVLAIGDKELTVGSPFVDGATVTAVILKSGKAKKITVFTYKSKKNFQRKMGHRQPYTKVKIQSIALA